MRAGERPGKVEGIVDRAVVRLVTPGTVLEPDILDSGKNNYLAAAVSDGQRAGFAYIDISTSEFVTQEMAAADLRDEVERLGPTELLVDDVSRGLVEIAIGNGPILRELDAFRLDHETATESLKTHFGVVTLEAYGCENRPLATLAAAEALSFLRETQLGALPQITTLRTESPTEHVKLDRRALRDLEVLESRSEQAGAATLLNTIDRTRTAMGARMLRAWLARPLMNLEELTGRQDRVERFVGDPIMRAENTRCAAPGAGPRTVDQPG